MRLAIEWRLEMWSLRLHSREDAPSRHTITTDVK